MNTFILPGRIDFTARDLACFTFALGIHSLLLLWKGGHLLLPNQQGKDLGEMLVQVTMLNDVPDYQEPAGGGLAKPKSFFQKMKAMVKGERPADRDQLAMGNQADVVEPPKPAWTKTDALSDKGAFKKEFDTAKSKSDLKIAVGGDTAVVEKPSMGNFKVPDANLKENTYKIAKRDAPFAITKPSSQDALSNVNMVPVVVGKTTSNTVRSLDGGPTTAPALQSKSFGSSGGAGSAGAFGSSPAGVGGKSDGGGGLAMGSAAGSSAAADGAGQGGVGTGAGSGSGSGSGYGSGAGSGSGSGTGSGRGYSGTGFGTPMRTLGRNTVTEESRAPAGVGKTDSANSSSSFDITGQLRNRPIATRVNPGYEFDCRVGLRFRVDWSGKVLHGILVDISSGSPTFDNKVIEVLKQWRFSALSADRVNEIQEGVIVFRFKGE